MLSELVSKQRINKPNLLPNHNLGSSFNKPEIQSTEKTDQIHNKNDADEISRLDCGLILLKL